MPRLLSVALWAVVAGCGRMPEYHRPELPVSAQWSQPSSADASRLATSVEWRAFFPDPRLQGLIAAAIENNRDLRIAVARVDESRALLGIARVDRLPNVDLSSSGAAARTPADLSLSGRTSVGQRFDAGLSLLSFELDFWGRVRSLNEAALAGYLASEEAGRAVRLSLIADVANAYLGLLEMEERTELARETVNSREQTRLLVSRRRDAGLAGDLDYLQAASAFELARAELASLLRQRAAAANALVLLVGGDPPGLPAGHSLAEQGIVPNLFADMPSTVLLKRPDVLAAEQRLVVANANIGVARAAFLPRISLTAGVGSASSALAGLFDAGQGAWNFQPVLRFPLFDAGRAVAGLDLAEARRHVAVAEYEKTIQQAFREVAELLAAQEPLVEQLRSLERADQLQSERLRLAEARYQAGVSSYLEVLDAQRESYSARQAALQVRRTLLSSAAQLYKALGGGQEVAK